ncbi:MarR family winged helix-turn-helix transcriptional regulator [Psychroserpens luteolus]|uniref:MarR family winged helix-turn-helix transcriptional regulator n=1 Tax=Psychroserpens luteolus TaxID=2855840 RepID=UPI001E5CA8ED|nr:MarR family transcriptional regulator [Psychroserpens luteolus]MCD2260142.1 MarR family transcriptional regulator [Psychroserpens luteolus]
MSIEKEIKSTVKLDEKDKTVINLIYTNNWLKEKMHVFFKAYDLSQEQYNVLRILRGQKGHPANLSTIQDRMLNKMSNTTRLIDKLLKKEFVTRQMCASNRRKIEIFITKKGLNLLTELDQKVKTINIEITKSLNSSELSQLNKLLDKLRTP